MCLGLDLRNKIGKPIRGKKQNFVLYDNERNEGEKAMFCQNLSHM